MNRSVLFDSPFLLGFEHTRNLVERAAKAAADSYPPYNVEGRENGGVRITLAVAGFSAEQLEIQLEGEQLTIAGRRGENGEEARDFLHRGIAARASSAPLCWRTAWRWKARRWSTACCMWTSPGRNPNGPCNGY